MRWQYWIIKMPVPSRINDADRNGNDCGVWPRNRKRKSTVDWSKRASYCNGHLSMVLLL